MAGEWGKFRLIDVCTKIGSGATPRGGGKVYLERGKVALIRSQNVYNDGFHRDGLVYLSEPHSTGLANVQVEEYDVLLNITGDSVARSCQVASDVLPARVNQHVAIIRPDPTVLWPRFLHYRLVSPSMQHEMLTLAGVGGTRNALTKGMIEQFEISAPIDVEEQRAIAHILSTLDDKIELNRRMNETLEAIVQAIFKSWFVDFLPVRAKASGEPPESICRRLGLTPDLLALFPDRLVDSELGEIPEGWNVGKIDNEFDITMGQSPPGETYNEKGEGLPFYQGRTDFGFRFPTPRVFCTAPTRLANVGDTLISVRAPVGDINMAEGRCCLGRGVAAARHKSSSRSYTFYFMRTIENVFKGFEA